MTDRATGVVRRLRSPDAAAITLALLLAGGALLRLGAMLAVRPISYGLYDSGTYLAGAVGNKAGGLFADVHHPVGYSVWLRVVGAFTDSGSVLALAQHALGMGAGLALWMALRRLGAPIVVAAVGAAAVLLNLEVAQLEHSVMSEALYIPALAFGFAAAVYAATTAGRSSYAFALLAGVLAAVAYTARYPGLVWVPVALVLVVLLARGLPLTGAALRVAAVAVGVVLVLVPYGVAQSRALDIGLDYVPGEGWNAYAGIAHDADCRRFVPPPGTRKLCDPRPIDQRPTATEYYTWNGESPAFRVEPRGFPHSDALFQRFVDAAAPSVARYRESRGIDDEVTRVERYVDPAKRYLGDAPPLAPIMAQNPPQEAYERASAVSVFRLAPIGYNALGTTFDSAKSTLRIAPWILWIAIALTVVAMFWARRYRLATLACWVFVEANWVAAGSYNARYAVPISIVGVIAGCLAAAGLADRWQDRSARRRALAQPSAGGW